MDSVKMILNATGKPFYGMVDKKECIVYTALGTIELKTKKNLDNFLDYNKTEECEMDDENFSFFDMCQIKN